MKQDRTTVLFAAFIGALSIGVQASAQTPVIEEVVVTSQKREQNIDDVSVSVTAFSGTDIQELNLTNSVDLAAQTPGLNIGTPVGEGNNPSITLRGVGLNDFNDNNEGPVAVYRDEVYQSAMAGLTFQLYDLERAEVLRGPQGTLYGRNATGGLVHFISARPTDDATGYTELSIGENNQLHAEGALSGPLGPSVQGRISASVNQYDGYVENRVGPDGNEADSKALRLQLNYDASDRLSLLLRAHGSDSATIAPKYQHEATDFDGDGSPDATDLFGYADNDGDNYAGDYDRDGVLDIENRGASLTADWAGDSLDFVSITAFEAVEKLHAEDTDVGPFPALEPTFSADIEQLSQEFRFSGGTTSLNWVAGLYYFESEVDNTLDLRVNNPDGFVAFLDALPEADGGFEGGLAALTGYAPGSDPSALIPFLTYDVDYTQDTESTAVFGQTDVDLAPEWTLTLGLRYTSEERSMRYLNAFGDRNGDGAVDNADGVLNSFLYQLSLLDLFPSEYFTYDRRVDNDNISGKVGLDWQPTDDLLLFASFSQGFKSGGFNGGFLDLTDGVVPDDAPYDEEKLNAYEVGVKSTLLDQALKLRATGFYYDYQDYQALTFSGLSQFISNSDAQLYGAELEVIWLPTIDWEIQLGASLLDTEVDRVVVQGTPVSDSEMVLAPELTFNGLVRYSRAFGAGNVFSAQVDFSRQGEHFFDITNSDVSREDSYTVVNGRIAFYMGENLTLSLWGKNLTDEEYRVYTFDFTGPAGLNQQFYAPPRWFGATARYNF